MIAIQFWGISRIPEVAKTPISGAKGQFLQKGARRVLPNRAKTGGGCYGK
jgi:hypothetical protein